MIVELGKFEPVTLEQLDSVRLQDRVDTKYVFHSSRLQEILNAVGGNYKCLEIGGKRSFSYESIYFDTDTLKFYQDHYCGRLNRLKIRMRRYVDSGQVYFEIKAKNNKYRTVKSRIPLLHGENPFENETVNVLAGMYRLERLGLEPRLQIEYSRITLVDESFTERVTIDTGLRFILNDQIVDKSDLVIAEVKQGRAHHSPFTTLMKRMHIRRASLSKYCFGVVCMYPEARSNNFKPKILQYNKIIYGIASGH